LLNRVRTKTKKMAHLIEDLLSFSRLSTAEVQRSEIDMEALARRVFEELKSEAGERHIQLEIKPAPPAYGDLSMIHQVFVNLFSNAIKFTESRDLAVIEVGAYTEKDEDVYYVRDNGIGFDMQFSDKLFGLFQRLPASENVEGTGIGLVIIKNIVEKHGGRVWAEGKPAEGAIFYFSLPRKPV
jgi:light-regulated signal transduction histidine kinase (bacteriophytochrome)